MPPIDSVPTTESIGSYATTADTDVWDWVERLHELGDVVWDPVMNAYLVVGYDACKELAHNDIELWYSPDELPYGPLSPEAHVEITGGPTEVVFLRGEEHKRVHHFLLSYF